MHLFILLKNMLLYFIVVLHSTVVMSYSYSQFVLMSFPNYNKKNLISLFLLQNCVTLFVNSNNMLSVLKKL